MSLGVYIYQEGLVLLILKHVRTTTVLNLTYQTTRQSRKAPKMYFFSSTISLIATLFLLPSLAIF